MRAETFNKKIKIWKYKWPNILAGNNETNVSVNEKRVTDSF